MTNGRDRTRSPRTIGPGHFEPEKCQRRRIQRAGVPRLRRHLNTTIRQPRKSTGRTLQPAPRPVELAPVAPAPDRRPHGRTASPAQWIPFPPSIGPVWENWSAPGRFRHPTVPRRTSFLPASRPSRKHPPEHSVRSGESWSGRSSSLLSQSQSTKPDFQKNRKVFKFGSFASSDPKHIQGYPACQKVKLTPRWLRFSSSSSRQPWSNRRSARPASFIRSPSPAPDKEDDGPPRSSRAA